MRVGVFCCVFIVLVILKFYLICILYNHTLHDFETSFHRCRIQRIFFHLLYLLLRLIYLFLSSVCFLCFNPEKFFILIHVSIKYHPLSCFNRKDGQMWWVSLHSFLSQRKVECHSRTFLEIKLISKRLFVQSFVVFCRI